MMRKMDAPRPSPKCRHLFKFLWSSGSGVGGRKVTLPGGGTVKTVPLTLGFACAHCGENIERKATSGERRFYAQRVDLDDRSAGHKVWEEFNRRFREKNSSNYRWIGYDLIDRVERWAKRHPKDVRLVRVDDSSHSSSVLVLIEHRTPRSYMGTTVVFIPQCTGGGPTEFFLYPNHARRLVGALRDIMRQSKKAALLERQDKAKDCRDIRKNMRHPPVI